VDTTAASLHATSALVLLLLVCYAMVFDQVCCGLVGGVGPWPGLIVQSSLFKEALLGFLLAFSLPSADIKSSLGPVKSTSEKKLERMGSLIDVVDKALSTDEVIPLRLY
jgi:hypothetical protein